MESFTLKIFQFFCHQLPERSLHFESEIFPLCFRCSGIYLGIFIGYVYYFISGRINKIAPDRKKGLLLTLLIIPISVDGIGNACALWNSSEMIRLISGMLFGIYLSLTLVSIPNVMKMKGKYSLNINYKDLVVPIFIGFISTYFFMNINSKLIFNFFIYAAFFGWLIAILKISLNLFDLLNIKKKLFYAFNLKNNLDAL